MTLRIKGSTVIKGLTSVGWSPNLLFAAGEQGVWYDPSDFTTMFQDTAGTTPVTATTQSVGCILDKRNPSYSVYFDGTGDYLTLPTSDSLAFGTGDYSVEMWLYPTNLTGYKTLFMSGPVNGLGNIAFYTNGGTTLEIWNPGAVPVKVNISISLSANVWSHLAVTRSSGTVRVFVNGVLAGSATDTFSYVSNGGTAYIGTDTISYLYTGYICNLRIVKGTALYTANFTPPTAPLSAVGGTSLLTCGTSWSGNPAITVYGDTRADKLNPFNTGTGNHATQATAANRPTLQIDGNGKYYLSFDGSNDYLQVASFTLPLIQRMTMIGFQENAAVANQGCISVYPATGNDYDSQTGYLFGPSNRTISRFVAIGTTGSTYSMEWTTSPASIIPASVITEDKQTSAGYLRVNGTQVASDTSFTQFSANSNGGLLLGARWLSSAIDAGYRLNGRIYGLIIRGAASTASQITMAETYMNGKTAAY